MKVLIIAILCAGVAAAQYTSPAADTSVTIAGKKISIQYHAPQIHGRPIFGGLVPYGEVWRAGANEATALHTDAALAMKSINIPKGDYTLFVFPQANQFQLIINKQTGQWGLEYDKGRDLGRVPMDMGKTAAVVDAFKITLSGTGGNNGKLKMEWDKTTFSVPFTVVLK
jgi:hypothetical protein